MCKKISVTIAAENPECPELLSDLRTFLSHKVVWDGAVLPWSRYGRLLELVLQIEPEEEPLACDSVLSDSFANISLTTRDLVTSTPCKKVIVSTEKSYYMFGDNTQVAVVSSDAMDSRGCTVQQTVIPLRPLGGVQTQLKLVTDAVQAILAEPEKANRRRRQPVNGILLFGPAGTGKSLLAETVSRSVPAAHRQVVAGPELYSKYLGETEAQLRQVFAAAMRSAPAVIVLEDLDSLAPRRESGGGGGGGGSDLERRLTVTLQTLLDRLGQDQSRNKERLFVRRAPYCSWLRNLIKIVRN
jgi:hypothetical protein